MIRSLPLFESVLTGIAAALGLGIAIIACGVGSCPEWLPAQARLNPAEGLAKSLVAPTVTLQNLAISWQTPLFSTDRSPDPSTAHIVSNLTGVTLTGVLINVDLRIAMLKRADGSTLDVHQGQTLPNGWTLQTLTPTHATFSSQGRTQRLSLHALRLPPPSLTPPISLSHESTP